MFVEKIIDKDGDGFEFEITVSDGQRRILCFAYSPIEITNKNFKLYAFEPENLRKTLNTKYLLEKLPKPFEYKINAQVLDRDKGIAQVYGFVFEIGAILSTDIHNGDFVEFVNVRMDCENY